MADFDSGFGHSMNFEGGYVDDPDDPGRETFGGISRRFHPDWAGWQEVDRIRAEGKNPEDDPNVMRLHRNFYKTNYWDFFNLDRLQSQLVAAEMLDTGINMGVGRVVHFVQRCLNSLNERGIGFPLLKADGQWGGKTQNALWIVIGQGKTEELTLWKQLNCLQGERYLLSCERNAVVKKFVVGWFKRVFENQ